MGKTGSTRNYKCGPKNNWRRTIWNDILRRTDGRQEREPILYLAGPQDLDRAIAIKKGVPTQNMIAIDLSASNVANVRQQKAPSLRGDIFDVLESWPTSRPVCAVLLDFCCGLTTEAIDVYDVFERPPLRHAVLMVNFMRGRDPFTNAIRAQLTDTDAWPMAPCHIVAGARGDEPALSLSEKHRALQFVAFHAIDTWNTIRTELGDRDALHCLGLDLDTTEALADGYSEKEQTEYLDGAWFIFAHRIFEEMRPSFYSYKSGSLTFDSAVLQPIARGVETAPSELLRILDEEARGKYPPIPTIARKIGAMLAVRTKRQ